MWSLSLSSPPAAEPLDLEIEVRQHLRLEPEILEAQRSLVEGAVAAARQSCETFTGRQIITASWELYLDTWYERGIYRDGAIYIPKGPLIAGTVVITHLDSAGVTQTWTAAKYVVGVDSGPAAGRARIFPAYGESFPTAQTRGRAIRVAFDAGYGTAPASVPGGLRAGMLLHVGETYERRELQTVGTIASPNLLSAHALWAPYRLF